jgi:crotonobetainyl-CoA:carnitine CoA-transferase CaiB-like acyl-CoA transferase
VNGLRHARVLDASRTALGGMATRCLAELGAYVVRPEPDPPSDLRWRLRHRGKRIVSTNANGLLEQSKSYDLVVVDTAQMDEIASSIDSRRLRLCRSFGDERLLGDEITPDFALASLGGLTFVTGDPSGVPTTPRDLLATRLGALYAACLGAAMIVDGLSGRASWTAELYASEAVASCLECILPTFFVDGMSIPRATHMNDIAWPVTVYQAGGTWMGISCGRIEDTRRLMELLDLEELVDPSVTEFSQLRDFETLDSSVASRIASWDAEQLVRECQSRRIAAGIAIRPGDILRDVQAIHDRFFDSWDDGTVVLRSPVKGASGSRSTVGPPQPVRRMRSSTASVKSSASNDLPELLGRSRILDFTWALAGPFATMILADLGADVVKVESRGHVDSARLVGPYPGEPDIEKSGYFRFFNRNKRSVEFDLGAPEDRRTLLGLSEHADVVLENFRPGSLDAKGLGYVHLSAVNRRIAMCSISGFGRSGPRSSWASYGGAMAECANGIAMATGGDRPLIPGKALADIFAGLNAALGACAQIYQRERRGQGSYIEVTQFEAGASTLDELLVVGPDPEEAHAVEGSDASGWWARGKQGRWPVADAASVARHLEVSGALQKFSSSGGEDVFLGLPASVAGKRLPLERPSPLLGEHTREVIAEWSAAGRPER